MFHVLTEIHLFSEISPDSFPRGSRSKMRNFTSSDKTPIKFGDKGSNSGRLNGKGDVKRTTKQPNRTEQPLSSDEYLSDDDRWNTSRKHNNGSSSKDVFSKDGSHRPSGLRSRKGDEDYTPEMPSRTTRNSKSQVSPRFWFLCWLISCAACFGSSFNRGAEFYGLKWLDWYPSNSGIDVQ